MKKFIEEIGFVFWRIGKFVDEWIYPGYFLKNLLFYRHDLIKIDGVKPYEYCDITHKMFVSNMKLIVDFIEKEKPEEVVLWYKDEEGNDAGHKYGECKEVIPMMFPEYEGKWIMDIIKEIYHWYKEEYPKLLDEQNILEKFYLDETVGKLNFDSFTECTLEEFKEVVFDKSKCAKNIEELKKKNYDFDVIKKYLPNEEEWLNENVQREKVNFITCEIERQKLKYSHLCIEVMAYLWT